MLLARIYGEALRRTGLDVRYKLNVGRERVADAALRKGAIDAYPEYTGTALTALLGVDPSDVPADEGEAYRLARDRYARRGITALPPTPFTNSNALGLTKERARALGNPKTISDLARDHDGELSLAASKECFERADCAPGFRRVYGLRFAKEIVIDVAERHEVILDGRADLTVPFTTDGQIVANDEVILEDDKDLFPPYNVTLVLRREVAEALGPATARLVDDVQRGLTTEVMQELNSRVDLDEQAPARVATDYLRSQRLVP